MLEMQEWAASGPFHSSSFRALKGFFINETKHSEYEYEYRQGEADRE